MNSFWYPSKKMIASSTKEEFYSMLYREKKNILKHILSQHPNTANYDKVTV